MTYIDADGHEWSSRVPPPYTECLRCGESYDDAEGKCKNVISAGVGVAEFDKLWSEFESFARETFEDDLARCREKAFEYGSADLEIMGQAMQSLIPRADMSAQERRAAGLEMSIAFYLMGKASRLFGAWNKGREPGDDSWRDGTIYTYMARFVRKHGRWM